ncbi:GGDEF domain-containing protein [Legionella israelensis]|nr:GGDEF domain-containing protein [Legionella israelensis]
MTGGAILGIRGLFVYTCLSLISIFFFILFEPITIYEVPPKYLTEIFLVNILAILLLETTLLYSLLYENLQFSTELMEQNFLLQADQKKFHYLARHDNLTNLPNRTYFNAYLENLLGSVNSQTHSVTLFFMDLDRFKVINDTYGHHAGDQVLLECSKRLQRCLRNNDFIARLGGDEFIAVIVHNKNDNVPDVLAKRILQEFNHPFHIEKNRLICHLSLGAASYPSDAASMEELLKKADKAMYAMKIKNRNREN